jgi:hypothetical protein
MPANETVTRTQRIFLRPDGIVQCVNISGDQQALEHAQENVRAVAMIGGGVRRPLFVDTTIPAPLSREGQAYYTSPDVAKVVTAVAIVAANVVGRVIGNVFLGFQRSEVPVRLFANEAEAVRWLGGFRS